MNSRKMSKISVLSFILLFFLASCVKEGPMGLQGEEGAQGPAGQNGNESCKVCHNPAVVDQKAVEFQFSKHEFGEAAFEEAGSTSCGPCHEHKAFQYVCKNNTPVAFVKDATTGKYSNPYVVPADQAYGELTCFTCHSKLHSTYALTDFFPLTNVAAVSMTMWGGAKTINLPLDGGVSNLCVKCHQPRPRTASNTDGNLLDYASFASNPTAIFYDPAATTTNKLKPSYRMEIHYGTVGAIFAGMGGVEFKGTMGYANMIHTSKATCVDCHMATMTGKAGGHTFTAKGNFNGCNTTACHGTGTVSASSAKYWTNPRTEIKKLLDDLAAKLKVNGIDIMNRNPDASTNLWGGLTTNNYDGYINIYDPATNPTGPDKNPAQFQNPSPSSSWTQAQKDQNAALPKITLTNAQMGALINFQLCLREFSLGIHNYDYTKALLTNSIAVSN
jgi:hypothetical protein